MADDLEAIRRRRPLEAAAIASMSQEQKKQLLEAMERGFSRRYAIKSWWRRLLDFFK